MAKDDTGEADNAEVVGGDAPKKAEAKAASGMLPVILIGVSMVVASAVATFFVVKGTMPATVSVNVVKEGGKSEGKGEGKGEAKGEGKGGEAGKAPLIYGLDEMFLNVAETKGTRVLKLMPFLVFSEESLRPILEQYKPMLRDCVSQVASRMTIDELQGVNARNNLRKSIVSTLNTLLSDKMAGSITDVYFSDFLIQ